MIYMNNGRVITRRNGEEINRHVTMTKAEAALVGADTEGVTIEVFDHASCELWVGRIAEHGGWVYIAEQVD